ncbi:MAG: hypothetical protein U0744_06095 [Gemmataceae bacterium]
MLTLQGFHCSPKANVEHGRSYLPGQALTGLRNLFRAKPDWNSPKPHPDRVYDWVRSIPYWAIHASVLGVIWVGWSWPAVAMCAFMYALRVFTLTAFYHRYFSHRSFKCGRVTRSSSVSSAARPFSVVRFGGLPITASTMPIPTTNTISTRRANAACSGAICCGS